MKKGNHKHFALHVGSILSAKSMDGVSDAPRFLASFFRPGSDTAPKGLRTSFLDPLGHHLWMPIVLVSAIMNRPILSYFEALFEALGILF